jgi:ribulose-5-phosphate 4-epimerase/fuculose-1-phosphate aldolase
MNAPTSIKAESIYWDAAGDGKATPALPMSDIEWAARVKLAACYRIFARLGWTELIFNHITLRVPGPTTGFLINPFGLHYSEVTASNLVLIDAEGRPLRASEWPVNRAGFVIHSAIHANLPHAHCVMHTHTTTGMGVASTTEGLSPDNFYGAQLYGEVAYHDFQGVTVDDAEKQSMLDDIGSKHCVILRNHGLLAWGETVEEAFLWIWTLQRACDVQVAAASAGTINRIKPAVFEQTRQMAPALEPRLTHDVFNAMQRMLDIEDPSYRH